MKLLLVILLTLSLSLFTLDLFSQSIEQKTTDSIFRDWGEVYFKFSLNDRNALDLLTRTISIDNYKDQEVYAYANRSEFESFLSLNIPYTILPNPGGLLPLSEIHPQLIDGFSKSAGLWNFYPTYQQYLDTMHYYAATYPELCRLDTIGSTLLGRKIIALKISDSVNVSEAEPEFFYTSSIHGDETTAYVLMLHLIDSLVTGYGVSPRITEIVNNTEIFINPLANPDGTYRNGSTITNPTRGNYAGVDLNRNFPDPGGVNTGVKQPETLGFMDYASNNHFVMAANFHGGIEVYNYPWDRWSKLTPDDNWWRYTGREYADTAQKYSPAGYFDDLSNGITNGYAWYQIFGGRQDYMNFFQHCREVTIEISTVHFLPASQLMAHWNYNYRSFLNYIEQSNYGFQGIVTDTVTGEKLHAKVFVLNHDIQSDSTFVYSKLPSGFYARPINQGTYSVTFSAAGYFPKTINDINIQKRQQLRLDVQLRPLNISLPENSIQKFMIFPNPNEGCFDLHLPYCDAQGWLLSMMDITGKIQYQQRIEGDQMDVKISINRNGLPSGMYIIRLSNTSKIFQDKLFLR